MLMLLSLFAILLSGCGSTKTVQTPEGQEVKIEQDGSKVTAESEEGKVEVDTGKNMKWPEEIPSDVPRCEYGEITGVQNVDMEGQKSRSVVFTGLKEKAGAAYRTQLEENGFTITNYMDMGEMEMVTAENNEVTVNATFDYTEDAGAVQVMFKE